MSDGPREEPARDDPTRPMAPGDQVSEATVPHAVPFYCEENAWQRARLPGFEGGVVVFISNPARQVAIFEQRAGRALDGLVVWDYHVVVLSDGQIHDPDHRLGPITQLEAWAAASFPTQMPVLVEFQPWFRVVGVPVFLQHFRSDRAHMRRPDGSWRAPPPPWPPIGAETGAVSNLMVFVDMEAPFLGQLMNLEALLVPYSVG